MKRFVIRML